MRLLEAHLSPQELISLPESREALTSGGTEQLLLAQHLQQCEACFNLAQTHWNLLSLRTPVVSADGGSDCPPQRAWLEFAAGLRSEQSAALSTHAASCSVCAVNLREAMDLIQFDQLDARNEGTEPMEGLASATTEWQHRVAVQMMSASTSLPAAESAAAPFATEAPKFGIIHRLRNQPHWINMAAAAVILCAVVLTGVTLWHTAHPSDAHLLALAYNKQRTLILRIPGADPVPLASGTRGPATGLTDPTELLELRLRAQQHLDQTPNSPYWHQILGQIQLLEQDGLGARRNFEIAQTTDENLPNLQSDLAAAWFMIGDKSGNAEAYAEAVELYGKQIIDHPTSLLYYNRAICWERLNLNDKALDDLHYALSLERSAAWRAAIQSEIARLSSPSATISTDGYETALAEATQNLLPHWGDTPSGHARITQTAELGLRHNDRWLLDWVEANHTAMSIEADSHLSAAIAAGAGGEAQPSLAEAHRAIDLYTGSNQHPGLLRARLAELFALQRLGRVRDCLDSAARLESDPNVKSYSRMRVQLLLDEGACKGRDGDLAGARLDFAQANSLSLASGLPVVGLTAIASQAEVLRYVGMASAAWQLDVSGLKECMRINCPPGRKYPLLYNMVTSAQGLSQPHVAADLMRTAESLAGASGNPTTHAYAVEALATLTGRIGDYAASDRDFAQAFALAHFENHSTMAKLYQAVWETDEAEVLSRKGNARDAINLLQESAPVILASDYQPGRISYFSQLSTAQLSLGRSDEALTNAKMAVHEAEISLHSLHSTLEREQWARKNADVYAELVSIYLRRGENTSALQAWERFRSAPYPRGAPDSTGASSATSSTGPQVVILAQINDSYVGWLAVAQPLQALRTVVLGDRAHLRRSVTTFYRLCADRNSTLDDVKHVGSGLYKALLAPLRSQLADSRHLWIELDPSIAMLPLSALITPDGKWYGDSTSISVLSPWWSLEPSSEFTEPAVTKSMHMVVASGFARTRDNDSEVAEIARFFPNAILIDGVSATPAEVMHNLASAEIFHFSGHANSDSGAQLLLSSNGSAVQSNLTPEAFGALHLSGCRLAVLAACNTTSVDPDQIERLPDLRNALLLSGVQTVVASNWDVDDRSTRSLMLDFYNHLVLGLSPARALQLAQKSIYSTSDWQHPYYWAAFETFIH
jgi:CHAT domain-containing protein